MKGRDNKNAQKIDFWQALVNEQNAEAVQKSTERNEKINSMVDANR